MKRIIFHHPLPLDPNAKSASGIRPVQMLNAFQSLGYQVDLVTGYSKQRKASIKTIKENIDKGIKYSFVYSESSTMPTVLTDTHHLPIRPFIDFNFFRLCKKQGIAIGLFYRDIYWAFDGYGEGLNFLKVWFAKHCYHYDLINYKKYLTKLYLPSLEMCKYVPVVDQQIMSALPPGHLEDNPLEAKKTVASSETLDIFYVGGVGAHYNMQLLVQVVAAMPEITLTICTRQEEWQSVKHKYPKLTENIMVVHLTGEKMKQHMLNADIVSIFVEPKKYWEFAAPVKLYEYLGSLKPILASKGTLAANFIEQNKAGWTVSYDAEELTNFLSYLTNNKNELLNVSEHIATISNEHSWLARAQQVAKDLSKGPVL